MSRQLHIVCLDNPWPPDYGGAIDMMNRLIALHDLGIIIHLHYFQYNDRNSVGPLWDYCKTVNVYERKLGKEGLSRKIPYIVSSRMNDDLLSNLKKDNYPILLEGLHCTGILAALDLSSRKVVVRLHNEESIYYKELARSEHSIIRKLFFWRESRLIRRYSHHLPENCTYACISDNDMNYCKEHYHLGLSTLLPAFPTWQEVRGEEGMGNLCLYHGNLSVPENEEAAIWLLTKVFTLIKKPLVIAGKKPSRRLKKLAHLCQHTCLVENPTEKEMNDLVRKAHIHLLPSFNKHHTGIRFKLLHALFEGRHCVANEGMVKGTGLEDTCHIGSHANSFASIILQLYHQPFSIEEINLRKRLLVKVYDNKKNAEQLIRYLW